MPFTTDTDKTVIQAMSGDKNAQKTMNTAFTEAGKNFASDGVDASGNTALALNVLTIVGIASGDLPLAIAAGDLAVKADTVGLGLSAVTQDPKKILNSAIGVFLDKAPGMISPKLAPTINESTKKLVDPKTSQPIIGIRGEIAVFINALIGIFSPKVIEEAEKAK